MYTAEEFTGLAGEGGVGVGRGAQRRQKTSMYTAEEFTGLAGEGGVGVGRGAQRRQKTSMYTAEEFTGLAGGGGGGGVLAKMQHALGGGQFTECP